MTPSTSTDTPYNAVTARYDLPFPLYAFQQDAVNELSLIQKSGLYLEPGLGKTAVSTCVALYKMMFHGKAQTLVVVPPILITQWAKWLSRVTRKDGPQHSIALYQGSPATRKQMKFNADFIIMSLAIFKRDFERIDAEIGERDIHVILDEGHSIKDVGTDNHKFFRDFVLAKSCQILTGTPLTKPVDAYAYCKIIAPGLYRNLAHFEGLHIAERDFFKNPIRYANLDLLKQNLLTHSVLRTKEEVLDLPPCTIQPIEYPLDAKHYALYRKIAEEQLLLLPDGNKLDLTQVTALYHAMGQVPCQWHHFAQNDKLISEGYKLVAQTLEELGDKKLVVFANYRRTNEFMTRHFNCPGIWGEVSAKEKQVNWNKFLNDPKCRLIIMHSVAGGQGLDGAQEVCSDVLYLEPPVSVSHWTQSLSRIHRQGQIKPVTIRMGVAVGTLQAHILKKLMEKEELVNPIQNKKSELRAALYGG